MRRGNDPAGGLSLAVVRVHCQAIAGRGLYFDECAVAAKVVAHAAAPALGPCLVAAVVHEVVLNPLVDVLKGCEKQS